MSDIVSSLKFSPLDDLHHEARAKMIDFAGWSLPVFYQGIRQEHLAVREKVGVFDVSHMGEFFVTGVDAATWLESVLCNRVSKLQVAKGQYTFLLNEKGGIIDDLLLYRIAEESFLLVVNASRIEADYHWLAALLEQEKDKRKKEGLELVVTLENQSDDWMMLALQGPDAPGVLRNLFPDFSLPKRNQIFTFPGFEEAWIARTGYTGEDGFEVMIRRSIQENTPKKEQDGWEKGRRLWQQFLEQGVTPSGLGARDTLRLEMGYSLYGADLSTEKTPLEAGLSFFVPLEDPLKPDFMGRAALLSQQEEGVPFQLTPVVMVDKGPPLRAHYPLYLGEEEVSELTSGALSPTLGKSIGLAYLPHAYFEQKGEECLPLRVLIRDRFYQLQLATLPFYKKS